jgi:hypothetical protein
MDPKPSHREMWLAPSAGWQGAAALKLPAQQDPPPLDEHLVQPEAPSREQLVRGRKVIAMPALPPHGDRHFKLDYVLGAHLAEGYVGSTDLLTRTGADSDFATDTCVRRAGTHPDTHQRYLEELAFEMVNEQSLRDVTEKAEELTARGVRRVVAIFVKKGEVREWSGPEGWKKLPPESTFSDPTLARPLLIRELLDAAEADNAVVRALAAKHNPVLAELVNEGRDEGQSAGLRRGIEALCKALGIDLTPERRTYLSGLSAAKLGTLLDQLSTEQRWP